MSDSSPPPWYRRPLPTWFPAWLILSAVVAAAGGYLAATAREPTAWKVAVGCGAGAFGGLAFSILLANAGRRRGGPGLPHFRPPTWLALPVGVGVLVLIAISMIDESLRQGYYDGYSSRRGYYRIPGPFAIAIGVCCLALAGYLSAGGVWRRPRDASRVVGGVLGFAVLFTGLWAILA